MTTSFSWNMPENNVGQPTTNNLSSFSWNMPETEEDDDIISTDESLIETPSTDIVTADEQPTEDNVEVGSYSARDLTEDRVNLYKII
jgi:hypothetical protein